MGIRMGADMAHMWHVEGGHLAAGDAGAPSVLVINSEELRSRRATHAQYEVFSQLEHAAIPFVERMPDGAAGLVISPSGSRRFAFTLSPAELVLIDDGDLCATLLDRAAEDRVRVEGPTGALCALLRELLRDHPASLSRMREDFEVLEECILEGRGRVDRGKMMADSRRMLGLDTFYQGMSDLVDNLDENDPAHAAPEDRARLRSLAQLLGRLSTRLESLQSYSLQVHGLYQEDIDIRQNNVMQWLTVVATIAMPLTFITGWYGMNFPHMVLFDAPWGYPFVIAACVIVAVAEIAFFSHRGWLSFGGARGHRRRRDEKKERAGHGRG